MITTQQAGAPSAQEGKPQIARATGRQLEQRLEPGERKNAEAASHAEHGEMTPFGRDNQRSSLANVLPGDLPFEPGSRALVKVVERRPRSAERTSLGGKKQRLVGLVFERREPTLLDTHVCEALRGDHR